MNVFIIIPTYNEEGHIQKTIQDLQTEIAKLPQHDVRILIFDSQSTDQTISIVQSLQHSFSNIELMVEAQKSGLGSAYIQAMRYLIQRENVDVIFEFDADGSHQPIYISKMLAEIENGADVVVGSRYVPGGKIEADWAWYRHIISRVGNWIARLFLTSRYHDLTSGLRASRVSVLKKIALENLLSKNYAYKIHLFWELHQRTSKIVEIPITFVDRQFGVSKFPRNNILESLKVVCLLWWRTSIR